MHYYINHLSSGSHSQSCNCYCTCYMEGRFSISGWIRWIYLWRAGGPHDTLSWYSHLGYSLTLSVCGDYWLTSGQQNRQGWQDVTFVIMFLRNAMLILPRDSFSCWLWGSKRSFGTIQMASNWRQPSANSKQETEVISRKELNVTWNQINPLSICRWDHNPDTWCSLVGPWSRRPS